MSSLMTTASGSRSPAARRWGSPIRRRRGSTRLGVGWELPEDRLPISLARPGRTPDFPCLTSSGSDIVYAEIISAKTKEVTMSATEHSVETSATPGAIWRLWADVESWPEWNGDIERVELVGPFAAGGTIVMTPIGEESVELRIAEAVEPELFVDEAELGEIVVRTTHRVQPLDGERARVTYRMEITGPAADTLGPQIGPEISSDFPQTLAALAERAEA
jgi:Polyketide cyclase / dehydrase and lipid transport